MAISLSTIIRGQRISAPKIVITGVGGIGKNTFAASCPNPIFIPTEDGKGSLAYDEFPIARSWQDLLDAVSALYTSDHGYQTVVLDTLDFAEPLLWEYTSRKHGKTDVESFGYGKGYVYALDEARVLFDGFDALRNDRGMIVVLLAHTQIKRFEPPDADAYDRYKMRLQDRLSEFVHDWADAVLFAAFKHHVVKEDAGFKKTRSRGVGRGERVFYTEARPAWQAKNRYSLPPEIPLPRENGWASLQSLIMASADPSPDPSPDVSSHSETRTATEAAV